MTEEKAQLRKAQITQILTSIIACLLFGCATPPPKVNTGRPLLDRPEFEKCELDAFMALNIGRSHFFFNESKDRLLATAGVYGPAQKEVIEDLFKKIDAAEVKNHASFASGRFYGCMRSQRVSLKENPGGAAVCLARQDILFLAMLEKQKRTPLEKAIVNTKQRLSDRSVYPEKLIEGLTPMLYAADDRTNDEFALRQFVFQSCLFPDEWKAKHPE